METSDITLGDDTTLVYNWDNKFRTGTKGSQSSISLKYDPMGNRVLRTANGITRKYIVDISWDLPVILIEMDAQNNIQKTYIYANGQILAQHNGAPATNNKYFYLHDRLGSVRQVINQSGSVEKYYIFEPFGKTIEEGGTLSNPFMFTGQFFDSEINEYYLRARQYDPHIGRFTSRDAVTGDLEEPMTLHKYLYFLNNPVDYVDPSGEFLETILAVSDEAGMYAGDLAAGGLALYFTYAMIVQN